MLVRNKKRSMDALARLFDRYRKHGDVEALGRVFDRLAPRLLPVALHLCGNPADAEDVVQQTFLLAMDRADSFDATRRLEPWIAGLLQNADSAGRFGFHDVPPGDHKLSADAKASMPTWQDVRVNARQHTEIEVRLAGGVTVTGVVTKADGTSAPGLHVAAVPDLDYNGHINEHGTRTDGSYLMPWIPVRRFAVKVDRRGRTLASRQFDSPEPGVLHCDFVLKDMTTLRGRVIAASGRPLPAWFVSATDSTGEHYLGTSRTDASGRFRLRYLQGESFRIIAYPGDGSPRHPCVERPGASTSDGEIELRVPEAAAPRAAITGRLTAGGIAIADAEVALKRTGALCLKTTAAPTGAPARRPSRSRRSAALRRTPARARRERTPAPAPLGRRCVRPRR